MNLEEAYEKINHALGPNGGMHGWCTQDKGRRLARLVIETGASLAVESGVFGGMSLIALGYGARASGRLCRVIGIDPYTAEAALEGESAKENVDWWRDLGTRPSKPGIPNLEGIMVAALYAIKLNGLTEFVELRRAKSLDEVSGFADGSIGVFHQDSNHSELVSCAEVEAFVPKLASNGAWVFDDTDWETTHKAQVMLIDRGFERVEDYSKWAIFKRV